MEVFAVVAFLILLIIVMPTIVTLYILGSIGLMTIADKERVQNSWLAWIPVANLYLLAKLVYKDEMIHWGLPILFLLTTDINGKTLLPEPLAQLGTLVVLGILFYALFKIYEKRSTKALIMIIFSALSLGFLTPIFLFSIRNNRTIKK